MYNKKNYIFIVLIFFILSGCKTYLFNHKDDFIKKSRLKRVIYGSKSTFGFGSFGGFDSLVEYYRGIPYTGIATDSYKLNRDTTHYYFLEFINGRKRGVYRTTNNFGDTLDIGYRDEDSTLHFEFDYNTNKIKSIELSTNYLYQEIEFMPDGSRYETSKLREYYPKAKKLRVYKWDNNGNYKLSDDSCTNYRIYPNGRKIITGRYNTNRIREGTWIKFLNKTDTAEIINYRNGYRHGIYKDFNNKGFISEFGNYINGKEGGSWTKFYSDGLIKIQTNYKAGKKHGKETSYNYIGQLEYECSYSNDYKDGKYISYYQNGKIKVSTWYKNDVKHGNYKYYKEKGYLYCEGKYNRDLQEGAWTYYHPNGNIYKKGEYFGGRSIGKWKVYKDNDELDYVNEY